MNVAHRMAILEKLGLSFSHDARILDFGCGAGGAVYSLVDHGYLNTCGYDIADYVELRDPADHSRFFIADPRHLPFDDNSFDLIVSSQVFEHVIDQFGMLRELYRIMRPGGAAMLIFPARYCLIENHIHVPLGGVIGHRWWYKFWALLGIRNQYQKGLSADETADRNTLYFVEGLRYISNSCYQVVWQRIGYQYRWIDVEFFDTINRPPARMIAKALRLLPLICWLSRTFITRRVLLQK